MRLSKLLTGVLTAALLPAVSSVGAAESERKPTIYIAGDSTAQTYDYSKVYPQTGWGQVFGDYFTDDVVIDNRAMGGRSSKRFDDDGRLDAILSELRQGDYVFIQFGINDGAVDKPERYISAEDYKKLITDKYIGEVEKRGGIPVLLTPTAASWWDEENGCFMESRRDYAEPTREIAEETGVAFIDINKIMTEAWNESAKDDVFGMYFICEPLESKAYPGGTDDHTHLKEAGARAIAKMIAREVKFSDFDIAEYVRLQREYTDVLGHWAADYIEMLSAYDLLDGFKDGSFKPDEAVTRAEFLKMAMDAAGIVGHACREGECLDAADEDWYRYYLQGALDKGIIPYRMIENCVGAEKAEKVAVEATEDTEAVTEEITEYRSGGGQMRFDGDKPITREEMAAVAINCAGLARRIPGSDMDERIKTANTMKDRAPESFADMADVSEIYGGSVDSARRIGLIEGDDDCMFLPQKSLTRAEAAAVAAKLRIIGFIGQDILEGDNIG